MTVNQNDSSVTQSKSKFNSCHYCGCKHELSKQKCPAYGQVCRKCNKKDPFAVMCGRTRLQNPPFKKKPTFKQKERRVHCVEDSDSDDDYEDN